MGIDCEDSWRPSTATAEFESVAFLRFFFSIANTDSAEEGYAIEFNISTDDTVSGHLQSQLCL